MKKDTQEERCLNCEGSGIATIPDATGDDYEYAYCYCPEGKRAESCNAMRVLKVNFIESEGSPMIIR